MASTQTICGVAVDAFRRKPTPAELAALVARWDSDDQADFIAELGAQLRFACGARVFMQWQYIADALTAREEKYSSGHGSELIGELAERIKDGGAP